MEPERAEADTNGPAARRLLLDRPRTDEWVQIAPESARPATLTPEQPVKAPGQGGDIFLARGKPVEIVGPSGSRASLTSMRAAISASPGGWATASFQWGDTRIVRVFTEDKPTQEPVLPRRIKPEDAGRDGRGAAQG